MSNAYLIANIKK